jgi:ankyrin repeat protein
VRVCSAAAAQLWKVCKNGNLDGVQAVVNNTPQDQRAALLRAEESKGWVSLSLLLKSAILSTECLQPVGTGLHKAAALGHKPIVSYLLEMGAELDLQDSKVETWSC